MIFKLSVITRNVHVLDCRTLHLPLRLLLHPTGFMKCVNEQHVLCGFVQGVVHEIVQEIVPRLFVRLFLRSFVRLCLGSVARCCAGINSPKLYGTAWWRHPIL